MNLEKLMTLLSTDVVDFLSGTGWVTAKLLVGFSPTGNSGVGFIYFDQHMVEQRPYVIDEGLKRLRNPPSTGEIQRLLTEYYFESKDDLTKRWSEVTFIIYPDKRCESSFTWNDAAQIQYEFEIAKALLLRVYDPLYEQIAFKILPEKRWTTAVATVQIMDGKVSRISQIVIAGHRQPYPIRLNDFWQQKLVEIHKQTNEGNLKGRLPAWNTIILQLRAGGVLDPDKDVEYRLEPLA
jgi:hypothetical protein